MNSQTDCKQALYRFGALQSDDLAALRGKLVAHTMHEEINALGRLREFMQIHVFPVRDFMSLVKRLQVVHLNAAPMDAAGDITSSAIC